MSQPGTDVRLGEFRDIRDHSAPRVLKGPHGHQGHQGPVGVKEWLRRSGKREAVKGKEVGMELDYSGNSKDPLMAGQVQTKLENMKGKPGKAVMPLS